MRRVRRSSRLNAELWRRDRDDRQHGATLPGRLTHRERLSSDAFRPHGFGRLCCQANELFPWDDLTNTRSFMISSSSSKSVMSWVDQKVASSETGSIAGIRGDVICFSNDVTGVFPCQSSNEQFRDTHCHRERKSPRKNSDRPVSAQGSNTQDSGPVILPVAPTGSENRPPLPAVVDCMGYSSYDLSCAPHDVYTTPTIVTHTKRFLRVCVVAFATVRMQFPNLRRSHRCHG